MGFCRTNLFKRLESSGAAFQLSIERHILRNHVFLHAINHGLPLPLGTQDYGLLDAGNYDEDVDDEAAGATLLDDDNSEGEVGRRLKERTTTDFENRAAEVYEAYSTVFKGRFKWLRPDLFVKTLAQDLSDDAITLLGVLTRCGEWRPEKDSKLDALHELLTKQHPKEKIIVFTQFADTLRYLEEQLQVRGVKRLAGVTGQAEDPTSYAWRFSPVSNNKRESVSTEQELRILLATDVLSEGQNLQDSAIVVNFDLPWAIIRLIQRAGRVDRIGQESEKILCYSFLPVEGVENLIRLRGRVRQRLHENAEVVGTDEAFFEDEQEREDLLGLYNETAGILDGDPETEVDLASYAYQIWKNAIDRFPALETNIPALPSVVFSTRPHEATEKMPHGVLAYLRTGEGNDALAWIGTDGETVTESQFEILKAAECSPETPAQPRQENHHELVRKGVDFIVAEEKSVGGQLGRPSGARFRTYERLKRYAEVVEGSLFATPVLAKAIEEIYRFPLRQSATEMLNRQLRSGISDETLAELVMALRDDDRLCLVDEEERSGEPQVICSLGLAPASNPSTGG